MIEVELLELIEKVKAMKTEFQTIECKTAKEGCPKRLYDTLSAFSNQDSGGIILFGIDENKGYEAIGVYDAQDLQKKVTEQCKQMCPIIRPVFTAVQAGGGIIVSAEIPGIDVSERPCYYGGVGRLKGSYVRSGDSDEPMSDYEIYSYEAFRKKYQDDIRINEKADLLSIDRKKLDGYVDRIKENNPKLAQLPDFAFHLVHAHGVLSFQLMWGASAAGGFCLLASHGFGNPVPLLPVVFYPFGPSPLGRCCSLLT